jgi:hypothetical protein
MRAGEGVVIVKHQAWRAATTFQFSIFSFLVRLADSEPVDCHFTSIRLINIKKCLPGPMQQERNASA